MSKMQRLYLAAALMVIGSDQVATHFFEPNPVMAMVKWFGILFSLIAFVVIGDTV